MPKQLAKNTYQKLLDEIAGIYDGALRGSRARHFEKGQACLPAGRRILRGFGDALAWRF